MPTTTATTAQANRTRWSELVELQNTLGAQYRDATIDRPTWVDALYLVHFEMASLSRRAGCLCGVCTEVGAR